MTYWVLDIIFSLIVIIGAIIGIKKGAVKIFLSLLSTICAAFLTYFFSTGITSYLCNNFIEPLIVNKIHASLENNDVSKAVLPDFITKSADNFNVELDNLRLSNSVSKETVSSLVENNLSKPVFAIINIIVSIILFIVFLLILKFFFNLFNKLVKHSFVKGVNSFLGGVFGFVNGIVIIVVICFILSICFKNALSMPSYFSENSVNNSLFYRLFLYFFS
ncbi:MAG: CvpA family protein [Ruminococcaceae bacterium]|nr:CvpA family protein [Oscillospiraceae bacterium]